MPDIDMNILNNNELGAHSHLPFLDEVEAQISENNNARREGRDPRRIKPRKRFGEYAGRVDNGPIEFDDGTPDVQEVTQNEYEEKESAKQVQEENAKQQADAEKSIEEEFLELEHQIEDELK